MFNAHFTVWSLLPSQLQIHFINAIQHSTCSIHLYMFVSIRFEYSVFAIFTRFIHTYLHAYRTESSNVNRNVICCWQAAGSRHQTTWCLIAILKMIHIHTLNVMNCTVTVRPFHLHLKHKSICVFHTNPNPKLRA